MEVQIYGSKKIMLIGPIINMQLIKVLEAKGYKVTVLVKQ